MNPKMLSEEQLGHIVTHENIHISQWHQLDVVMAEILKILLWFFPVSWWYGKSIRTNLEFIADTNSLENGLDKKTYQLNLVFISQQPSGPVLVNNFSKKLIKNRIKMLNKMKTKRQILSFYAVLIPALVLISVGISVQAQSQNEKVKQIIVLSDEKIEPEDLKIQIKNENGEFEEIKNEKITLNPPIQKNDVVVIVNTSGEKMKIFNSGNAGNASWEELSNIDSKDISSVNVNKNDEKSTIVISYKNGRKNDTIIRPSNRVNSYSYSFKDSDKILSPKELKMKIKKGEFDLNKPENQWMKVWKEKGFKEPTEYNYSTNFEFNNNGNIEGDSIKQNSPWAITVQEHNLNEEILESYKSGNYTMDVHDTEQIIDFSGNDKENAIEKLLESGKKPLILINGKKASFNDYKKIKWKDGYTIVYTSKGEPLKKYGKKAKDGLLIINSRQYIAQ